MTAPALYPVAGADAPPCTFPRAGTCAACGADVQTEIDHATGGLVDVCDRIRCGAVRRVPRIPAHRFVDVPMMSLSLDDDAIDFPVPVPVTTAKMCRFACARTERRCLKLGGCPGRLENRARREARRSVLAAERLTWEQHTKGRRRGRLGGAQWRAHWQRKAAEFAAEGAA